ncbi:site-specific DNA-methyltransferase [Vibrio alginolyticus]|uniref:site-specific DNA-methyltransferase n=1 Tax=Vibrio alginolyticus TaxID=663 RepID=UPI003753BEE5
MSNDQTNVENYEFEPIKGYPMLNWKGKRPFRSTQFFPAQLKEVYGQEDDNGWINKIFWGDNLQVMSHLLKEFRGKVDLIYIDPPFDSKIDYKKEVKLKSGKVKTDTNSFEEKQYSDIWSNDEYLQFMYERLIMMKELLSKKGSIFLHCDWHKSHHLRCIMDEVFGSDNFVNEIIWCYYGPGSPGMRQFNRKHDNIFWYSKSKGEWTFNDEDIRIAHNEKTSGNFKAGLKGSGFIDGKYQLAEGKIPEDYWQFAIAGRYPNDGVKRTGYPTEKPFPLLERIIKAASNPGDIVFDCFMGSGVTAMSALKLGRRFIGADINSTSIKDTTARLNKMQLKSGLGVFHINNYEVFRNPTEAKDLLLEALEIQPLGSNTIYDGEKDGFKVKIMPVNRIATKEDLNELIQGFPYKKFEERKEANPNQPVEEIMLVCMGHEPGLGAILENESGYKMKVEVVDILRDKSDLTFKYDSEASIEIKEGKLVVEAFYPRNLLQKLSQQKDNVTEWREMVESIMIDWNYDGAVMEPTVIDIPAKDEFVAGEYEIPEGANNIKVKITDLLSESYEEVIAHD